MREPKTPLPWSLKPYYGEKRFIMAKGERSVALVYSPLDAAYAVHAANVLPEVTAALREIAEMFQQGRGSNRDTAGLRGEAIVGDIYKIARAALAKAEGAGEVGGG
jgi:hypothetical protein